MKNGECWLDDAGHAIQAHGGMMAKIDGAWYWWGENKDVSGYGANAHSAGVNCYRSTDMVHWHCLGTALRPRMEEGSLIHPTMICERPKVLRNPETCKYVMWFHCDRPDYTLAAAGVAVADRPEGPYTFLYAKQPNRRDCRDMTVVREKSGAAWLLHAGDWNKTMYLSRLTDDYLDFTGECYPLLIDQEREAPAIFQAEDGRWCLITSGCTGWSPNRALYALSPRLTCGWKLIGDPCSGPEARKTFHGQSSFVVETERGRYLLMDHWKKEDLAHSAYSLLPITLDGDEVDVPWTEDFAAL